MLVSAAPATCAGLLIKILGLATPHGLSPIWTKGVTLFFARFVSVRLAAELLRYYGGWADKIHGKTIEGELSYETAGDVLMLTSHARQCFMNSVNESKIAYTRAEP